MARCRRERGEILLDAGSTRICAECIPCFLNDIYGGIAQLIADKNEQQKVMADALQWLANNLSFDKIPSYYITELHRRLKIQSGIHVPFKERRDACNKVGIELTERLEKRLPGVFAERIDNLVRWCVAANHLDFRTVGTGYGFRVEAIEAMLQEVIAEGLTVNDIPKFLTILPNASTVLYLCDNVGEIALDHLLVKEMQKAGCQVTVAVKGGPITSDATLEDAQLVGFDRSTRVVLKGKDTLGLSPYEMTPEVEECLRSVDLVISKGQANFYAMIELKDMVKGRTVFLLRTKCEWISELLGTHRGTNVVKVI